MLGHASDVEAGSPVQLLLALFNDCERAELFLFEAGTDEIASWGD